MRKLKDWLGTGVAAGPTLEGEIATTYTEKDRVEAPSGHMLLPGTDVELVAYPVNEHDLMVLVNKGGDPHPERYSFITRVRSGYGPGGTSLQTRSA